MSHYIRSMLIEDIDQVTEIDREAFPTMWPPANYKREIEISLAYYVVACNSNKSFGRQEIEHPRKRLSGLSSRITLFHRGKDKKLVIPDDKPNSILGFGGLWIMADEAHITNVAVRKEYQRRGIGEHLLIAMINLAVERNAHTLALEVRLSNEIAQKLYNKYGFVQADVRHSYYTDNQEDALVMIADDIGSAEFQRRLWNLEKVYTMKWGIELRST